MASVVPSSKPFIMHCMMMMSVVFLVSCVTSTVPSMTFEAAFQGECGEDNPCEQLCFDLHDGTYECSCKEGHTLADNGYSCHENYDEDDDDDDDIDDDDENIEQLPQPQVLKGEKDMFNEKDRYFFIQDNTYEIYDKSKQKRNKMQLQSTSSMRLQLPNTEIFVQSTVPMSESSSDILQPMNTVTVTTPPSQRSSKMCDIQCENGGACIVDPHLDIIRCRCPLGKEGIHCEKDAKFHQPKFHTQSYLTFPKLYNVENSILIIIEFHPESYNGILLYSGQGTNNSTGDYMAIVLNNGFVEFRFDCGRGEGIIQSNQPIMLHSWNKLTLYRDKWDAWMQLNNGKQIHGQSQGLYSKISLEENLYLGGYFNISSIAKRLLMNIGFHGCVRYMKINEKVYNFELQKEGDIIDGLDVEECNIDGCSQITCLNGGKCVTTTPEEGVCVCALGYTGDICETAIEVMVPFFNNSFLQYDGLYETAASFLEIKIVFKPYSLNGAIFYNGNKLDGSGDFISINLINGYVEFRFNLGTGPLVVRSNDPITLMNWHYVFVTRTGRLGTLQVDQQEIITALSPGAFTQLTLSLSMFLGGIPNLMHVSQLAGITSSFIGCIQKLVINKRQIKLLEHALGGRNVANCQHPCLERPCYNGGSCQPTGDFYTCHCRLGYSGNNCQKEVSEMIAEPMFSGNSYLHYVHKDIIKRIRGLKTDLSLQFKSLDSNGLIMWIGKLEKESSDYLLIGITNGYLQLEYNLGSGAVVILNNYTRIDDGKWHQLQLHRTGKNAIVKLDHTPSISGSSSGALTQLNVDKNLYLGGMKDIPEKNFHYRMGLIGCLANLTLSQDYHVRLITHAKTGINILPCM